MTLSRQERLEDERADRAFDFLDGPLFWRFVHALDVLGWQIVPQNPECAGKRFPSPLNSKRKNWPSWIENTINGMHRLAAYWLQDKPDIRVMDFGRWVKNGKWSKLQA